MTDVKLRTYQKECIENIILSYKEGNKSVLVSLPTGSGKTVIFGFLIKEMNLKTLVLTHTEELLFQTYKKMALFNPDKNIGLFYGKEKNYDCDILVATVQSACMPSSLKKLASNGYDVIIADECHHAAADTWKRVIRDINPKILVGFTATAFRSDKKGLGEVFDKVVYEKSIISMINLGYLCPVTSKQIREDIDFSDNKSKDDFAIEYLDNKMNCTQYIDNTVEKFIAEAPNRKAIAFCTSVNHSENLATAFINNGYRSQFIHGGMDTSTRQRILNEFRDDKIQILTNCQVLTEGFDEPSVDCVIIAKLTKSKGAFQQMIGRGLRLYPNKTDCLVLDFTDINREIYSVARLLKDMGETASDYYSEDHIREREALIIGELPEKLNKELKTHLIQINLFPQDFTWIKDNLGDTTLKGTAYDIKILKNNAGFYNVITYKNDELIKIHGKDLDFEMAYGVADGFVKGNRSNFKLVDRDAAWRKERISDKQESIFRKKRYKQGIDELTRGQAADLIGGVLFKQNKG